MANILNWISDNKEWLFSGIGGILIAWIIKRIINIFFSKGKDDKTVIPPSEIGLTARSSFFVGVARKTPESEKYKLEEPD